MTCLHLTRFFIKLNSWTMWLDNNHAKAKVMLDFNVKCQFSVHKTKKQRQRSNPTLEQTWYSQFYIQLVFKAPLCITLNISDQIIMSRSLFLTPKMFSHFFFSIFVEYFVLLSKTATIHDFLVGNLECNTEKGFKNQLYIELGLHHL